MLRIDNLTYRINGRPLFEGASATIAGGWKVGLVGPNGAGKSTLLKLVKGSLQPDDGEVAAPPNWRIGGVEQEAPATNQSLIEIVVEFDRERAALLDEVESAQDPGRIADIHARLAHIGAHSAEARGASILAGLGFNAAAQARPAAEFSGGWRTRVALAGVLFSTPDLLLLDEPTNYLDLEGAIWLENFIRRFPNTAIIVSHDRDFLNRSVNRILALEHRKLFLSQGDFSAYERRRAEMREAAQSRFEREETQRKHLQSFIDRFRAKASKAKQAQSRIKMLERLQAAPPPNEQSMPPIRFVSPTALAPPIIRLKDADLGYGGGKKVLGGVELRIDNDDRIAILGPNGEGKSTLVKSIAGRLPLLSGEILRHKTLQVAYFAQHQLEELNPEKTPLDHVRRLVLDWTESEARGAAAAMGFSAEKIATPVAELSGGEKSRLLLGLATFKPPHLIILDEPTNHLDFEARESLALALNDFAGAVLLITHDAHLATSVADRIWLVKDGRVVEFAGDLDDYRDLVLSAEKNERRVSTDAPHDTRAVARREQAMLREKLAPLRAAADKAEERLGDLNAILRRLDDALGDGELYRTDAPRATKLLKERAALTDAISAQEEKWLIALEAYENANRSLS